MSEELGEFNNKIIAFLVVVLVVSIAGMVITDFRDTSRPNQRVNVINQTFSLVNHTNVTLNNTNIVPSGFTLRNATGTGQNVVPSTNYILYNVTGNVELTNNSWTTNRVNASYNYTRPMNTTNYNVTTQGVAATNNLSSFFAVMGTLFAAVVVIGLAIYAFKAMRE